MKLFAVICGRLSMLNSVFDDTQRQDLGVRHCLLARLASGYLLVLLQCGTAFVFCLYGLIGEMKAG